jgi:hypothetical protein
MSAPKNKQFLLIFAAAISIRPDPQQQSATRSPKPAGFNILACKFRSK